jgi:hypothetical protein
MYTEKHVEYSPIFPFLLSLNFVELPIHIHIYINMCMNTYVFIQIYTCVHMYIFTHINRHIKINLPIFPFLLSLNFVELPIQL